MGSTRSSRAGCAAEQAASQVGRSYRFRASWGDRSLVDKTVVYFLGMVEDPTVAPQPEEVAAYSWGTFEESLTRLSFPEGKRVLRQIEERLAR